MPSILANYLYRIRKAAEAEKNFYEFCKQAFPHFDPSPYIDGWHIKSMCDHLQAVYEGHIQNLIINIPPRLFKTAVGSVCFPAWLLIQNPGEQIFCTGKSENIVFKASEDFGILVRSDWFQINFGNIVQLSPSQNTKERRNTTANGFRVCKTILSPLVGVGGNYMIIDDPNNTKETDKQRETVNDIYSKSLAGRLNSLSFGHRILIMQRTGENDLTDYLLKKGGWVHLCLPMEFDPDRHCKTIIFKGTKKIWQDPRKEKDELLCSKQISKKDLKALYSQLNPYVISAQYQQNPTPDEGGIIKKTWPIPYTEKELPYIHHIIQSWDTAFTKVEDKENKSYIAYSVSETWGIFKDKNNYECILLLSIWRKRVDFNDLLKYASKIAKDYREDGTLKPPKHNAYLYRPDTVIIEALATGMPLIQELNRANINAIPFYPHKLGTKVERAKMVSHLIRDGRVYLPANEDGTFTKKSQDFLDECIKFPNGQYADQVDAFTQVLHYLRETGWLQHSVDDNMDNNNTEIKRKRLYD